MRKAVVKLALLALVLAGPLVSASIKAEADAQALVAYLKSMNPVRNPTPPITGPDQKPPAPFLRIVVPE